MQEEFEDTKGVIRIHKSKDRQHNGQKKKRYKKTYNDLQTYLYDLQMLLYINTQSLYIYVK